MATRNYVRRVLPLAGIVMMLTLSACGENGAGKKDTQVLAKVDDKEITVHQVNFVLGRSGITNKEQAEVASRQILERLINQELVLQKAHESRLEREPGVVQAIEASKREILVQAYMEKQLGQSLKPSSAEVDKFYSEHPELFAARRVYQLRELVVEVDRDAQAKLREKLKELGNIKLIADWLGANGYKFSAKAGVSAAETLPMPLLPQLQKMKAGDTAILSGGERTMEIIGVDAVEEQPLTRDKATPFIMNHLASQRAAEKSKEVIDNLRKTAKIEYLGEAAKYASAKSQQPKPEQKLEEGKAKQDDSIATGIKGL